MTDPVPADSPSALTRPDDLVVAVARYLRTLHGAPAPAGPDAVDNSSAAVIERARERLRSGEVDPSTFDGPYRPHDVERLLDIAEGLARTLDASGSIPVVGVHGALHLGDLRIADGSVVAPSPRPSGPGDAYVDLAFLARDLSVAIGGGAVPALFDAYGELRPNPVRIELWVTLRQFFP